MLSNCIVHQTVMRAKDENKVGKMKECDLGKGGQERRQVREVAFEWSME